MSEARQLELPVQVDPLWRCEQRLVEQVDREHGSPSTLVRQFVRWRRENPEVYERLEKLTRRLRESGLCRFGIAMIWEPLRYQLATEAGVEPKLNNSYRPYAARLLELHHPEWAGTFTKRSIGPGRERHIA